MPLTGLDPHSEDAFLVTLISILCLPPPSREHQGWGTQVSGDAPSLWLHWINPLACDLPSTNTQAKFLAPQKRQAQFLEWLKRKPAAYRCWNYRVCLWTRDTVIASLPMRPQWMPETADNNKPVSVIFFLSYSYIPMIKLNLKIHDGKGFSVATNKTEQLQCCTIQLCGRSTLSLQ